MLPHGQGGAMIPNLASRCASFGAGLRGTGDSDRTRGRTPAQGNRLLVALLALLTLATFTSGPSALATGKQYGFDILVSANQRRVVNAPYLYSLPHPDATWVGGDRLGYRCAYMFLEYHGTFVGRVTFTTNNLGSSAYTVINDRYMDEGAYFYDGSPAPEGTRETSPPGDCRPADEAYIPLPASEAGDLTPPLPVIQFADAKTGALLESRDYTRVRIDESGSGNDGDANSQPGHTFRIVAATPTQVTVVGYQDLVPVVVIYYELMPGVSNVRMTSNASPAPTTVTLELSGSLVANGEVRAPDGTVICEAGREVLIQQRDRGGWRTVESENSKSGGSYRIHLPDESGDYRALVRKLAIDGGTCARDTSPLVTNGGRGGDERNRAVQTVCIPPPPPDLDTLHRTMVRLLRAAAAIVVAGFPDSSAPAHGALPDKNG
jgi:hypothetical protein